MKVTLESFLSEVSEKTIKNNQYPVLTSSKDGLFLQSDYFNKQVASKDSTGYKVIKRGQFTYRAMSDTGEFFPNELECADIGIVSPAYPVFEISKPEIIKSHYLKYYFKSDYFQHQIAGFAQGSTRTSVKFGKLKTVYIDLPSVVKQEEVIRALDIAGELISKKQELLNKMDELIKARFVELFGDPICNSKGLPLTKGDSFFKLSNGKFVPEAKRFEEGIPVYGGNGISWYTDEALLQEDTIVVGRVGFQSGNVHYAEGPLMISDNAMYISWYDSEKYDLLFLCHLMEHIDFKRLQDAGDLKKITQKPFMSMDYIQPSLEQQYIYKSFVKQVDKSKVV